ncbi:MAG: hypothetical protein RLY78_3899 [Pseudomonadota bacterium]
MTEITATDAPDHGPGLTPSPSPSPAHAPAATTTAPAPSGAPARAAAPAIDVPWAGPLDLDALRQGQPLLWTQDRAGHPVRLPAAPQERDDAARPGGHPTGAGAGARAGISTGTDPDTAPAHAAEAESDALAAALPDAEARLARCAPVLAACDPALAAAGGVIESPLLAQPALQAALGLPQAAGALWIKADHQLPLAGSVKARGGFHEVLLQAETLARRHGLLAEDAPPSPPAPPLQQAAVLASQQARALFAEHEIAVGSTGNLGMAIGLMAAALGFRATVHMSAEAKGWKKDRLRRHGVRVVEHTGDYAAAVAAGRAAAEADPRAHFVDDERSRALFLGYAAAARGLARQLADAGRRVDAEHPLIVWLPCGVGGAPGGIAWGLQRLFGAHIHPFFVEPVASPCLLLQLLVAHPAVCAAHPLLAQLARAPQPPAVYDIGLDNRTLADGLAVPRASALVAEQVGHRLAGVLTVTDARLRALMRTAHTAAGLRLEPSAAAALDGPLWLARAQALSDEAAADGAGDLAAARAWLARSGVGAHLARATHVAWTTGGALLPDAEFAAAMDGPAT